MVLALTEQSLKESDEKQAVNIQCNIYHNRHKYKERNFNADDSLDLLSTSWARKCCVVIPLEPSHQLYPQETLHMCKERP